MTPKQNAITRKVAKDHKPVPACTEAFFLLGRCVSCGRTFRKHYGIKEATSSGATKGSQKS